MTTFTTPEPVAVALALLAGEVRLRAEDRSDTTVAVEPRNPGDAEDVAAAEQTRADLEGGRLTIRGPRSLRRFHPWRTGGVVDVVVALPSGSSLYAEGTLLVLHATGRLGECRVVTTAGDVALDATGSVSVRTSGRITLGRAEGSVELRGVGDIRVDDVTGSARAVTSNGAIHVGRAGQSVHARSANGTVVLGAVGGTVDAKTANGDIVVDDLHGGRVSVQTAAGRVEIGVREGTAVRLDLHTDFGRVENRLDAVDGPAGGDAVAEVRARTSMGDIVLRRPETTVTRAAGGRWS